jgi:glycosyltransferase involved in cell wall biosynthesis
MKLKKMNNKNVINNKVKVSVIIPCRNEEEFIEDCLESVISQTYPQDNIEIIVIDGMSEDETRKILEKYSKKYSFIKFLDNPKKITPTALNIGIQSSKGDVIVRMDAHAIYKNNYIEKCINSLLKTGADNVGGIWKIKEANDSLIAKVITYVLSSSFGSGDAYYKTKKSDKIREVDAVPFGCYRKQIFDKLGLFNEGLKRSQDMEFNLRISKHRGKIILDPNIVAFYYPKSNLWDFFKHNFNDGLWAIIPFKFIKSPLKLRHYMPLLFVLTLPFNLVFYFIITLFYSFIFSIKNRDLRIFFVTPIVFFVRHFAYGVGSVWGIVKLIID